MACTLGTINVALQHFYSLVVAAYLRNESICYRCSGGIICVGLGRTAAVIRVRLLFSDGVCAHLLGTASGDTRLFMLKPPLVVHFYTRHLFIVLRLGNVVLIFFLVFFCPHRKILYTRYRF